MCPASLLHIRRGIGENSTIQYELRDGRIFTNGRYHNHLVCDPLYNRRDTGIPVTWEGTTTPDSSGAHSNLIFIVRESFDYLELRTIALCEGFNFRLSMREIILFSMLGRLGDLCDHNPGSMLDEIYRDAVRTTSIAAPRVEDDIIAIVQTK